MPCLLACHSATEHAYIYAECRCMAIFAHYDHTMPLLQSLQWLPMPVAIVFSLAVLVYCCLHGTAPDDLVSELLPLSSVDARQQLWPMTAAALIKLHAFDMHWLMVMCCHICVCEITQWNLYNLQMEFVQSSPVPNISCLWLKKYEQYQWKAIRLVGTQQEVGITTTYSFLNWISLPWLLQAWMAAQRRIPGNNWSRLIKARCHSWQPADSVKALKGTQSTNANEGNSPTGLILSLSTNWILMEGTTRSVMLPSASHQMC